MLLSTEIKNKIEKIKEEMKRFMDSGEVDKAHAFIEDLKSLNKELEVANLVEKKEKEETINNGSEVEAVEKDMDINKIFNKLVMGKAVSDKEMAFYNEKAETGQIEHTDEKAETGQIEHTDEKGGYLVPEQQFNTIKEFRREHVALKNYCNVVPVLTMSGKYPVATDQKGKLINFDELNDLEESDVKFAQQKWSVKDYGDLVPVSNTLLDDTNFNIMEIIGKNFATKAVNTENEEILKILKTINKKNNVEGKDYKDISTILNTKLDPDIAATSIIITNQSGFDYLDKLEDKNARPLLTVSLTDPSQKLYRGKRIVVLKDEVLPLDSKKIPFYVGDLKEVINFYDRKGLEVARSKEAGFTKNATFLRAIERFDVQKVDEEAMIYLTIPQGEGLGK